MSSHRGRGTRPFTREKRFTHEHWRPSKNPGPHEYEKPSDFGAYGDVKYYKNLSTIDWFSMLNNFIMDVNMTIPKSFKWLGLELALGKTVNAVILNNVEGICIGVHELDWAIFWMGRYVHMHVCCRLVIDFASFLSDFEQRLKHSSSDMSDLSLR